jgi:poly(3-hydroxybutyrate) depolymerase
MKCLKYFSEVINIREPIWATQNEIVYSTSAFHLRKFQDGFGSILILPPNAGHRSCIADYQEGMSLVRHFMYRSNASIYCCEWRSCLPGRRNESIQDMVMQVVDMIRFIGEPVKLIGLCQAGWLSVMFASLYPEMVEKLVLGGSPIDFGVDSYIHQLVNIYPQEFYEWLVMVHGGRMPGHLILWGFKNMNIYDRYMGDYIKLWNALDGARDLARIRKFRDWYETTQWLAGGWYLEAVGRLFRKNMLVSGEMGYDLSRIKCPIKVIAGAKDDITPPEQLFNIERYVDVSVEKVLVDAGHIGLFIKPDALKRW